MLMQMKENISSTRSLIRKENHEVHVLLFTFCTLEKSILPHSFQAPLQRSKLFFDNLG